MCVRRHLVPETTNQFIIVKLYYPQLHPLIYSIEINSMIGFKVLCKIHVLEVIFNS